MAAGGEGAFLQEAVIYLGAAVVCVPIFKRLGLGSVLGYLAAGAAIGPHGLGFMDEPEAVLHFAEFGVVLLLFIIGLELRPSRLWAMRRDVLGLGTLQILVCGFVLAAIASAAGMGWKAALVAGLGLALSSTAFALQLLQERRELNSNHGRRAFAILLAQDMAIVPLLGFVALLSGAAAADAPLWLAIGQPVAVVLAVVLAGRFLLNPLFRLIALGGTREAFAAAALLLVAGTSYLMDAAGLSMALGAFLAGVMLAESEYRHQLEADLEPFRGLLLGLFFIAVGMSVDWSLVAGHFGELALAVLGLVAIKAVLIFVLARAFGASAPDAARVGVTLSQAGEFAFVLFTQAAAAKLLTASETSMLAATVTLSMVLTPLLATGLQRILTRDGDRSGEGLPQAHEAEQAQVIVAGFGRIGQVIAQLMQARSVSVTALDSNPDSIRTARSFGYKVFFGDVSRMDVLRAAGAGDAEILFVCVEDHDIVTETIARARSVFPHLRIIVRVYDRRHAIEVMDMGADVMVRETFESAIHMAREGLLSLGTGETLTDDIVDEFRRRDDERLALQKTQGMHAGVEGVGEAYDLPER